MATLTETFTNIADAIRSKTETTDKITPENMPAMIEGITTGGNTMELSITSNGTYRAPEGIDGYTPVIVNVPQDGSPPESAFRLTGTASYMFSNNNWKWFMDRYGSQLITQLHDCDYMFYNSYNYKTIPVEINIVSGANRSITKMFSGATALEEIPKINATNVMKMDGLFELCYKLKSLPEDIEDWFDWTAMDNSTSTYGATNRSNMFNSCYALRYVPMSFLNHGGSQESYSYSIYNCLFKNCHSLDEVVDLPNPHYNATWGNYSFYNAFSDIVQYCFRLKRFTFKKPDGVPYTVKWDYQVINLESVGFVSNPSYENNLKNYGGFTGATQITDDATYQALKDNPDSWTKSFWYSRYNKTSAIETINSLPDASAYVAEKGHPNTIKFKGESGLLTDGGAINTMTEEEIAVATAKGWTVSFA